MIRIDNYLEKLEEHLEKMQDKLSNMNLRQEAIIRELRQKEDYADKIEELKQKLEKLDEKLGVNKK